MQQKRNIKVAVISDVHLGTYGCHATELNKYLKSIDPEVLIINGDFIDIWQLSKFYFPDSHWRVIQRVIKMMMHGTRVYYLTGNHDEMLRKFSGFQLDNLCLEDKLVLTIGGQKHWFFHGDVFDVTMRHSKWLAKIGGLGYDFLILINRAVNLLLQKMGREKISLSKRVKDSVKAAVKHISNFEQTAAEIAIQNNYSHVICGHIHEPVIRAYETQHCTVQYLNSGDWIENLTALEYNDGWSLVHYKDLGLEGEKEEETIVRQLSPDILAMQDAFEKHRQLTTKAELPKEKLTA
ncbi:MAG TPA: UDP-2,3-diacylglucosamine diphosphatase [Chitinophagales bacterium]|nr:UDP-2,3-diacylglucosamine diphosphatase [Chitinophagales bacterium]